MLPSFERTIRAIADVMIRQQPASTGSTREAESVSAFLLATHGRMPDYLRLSFRLLTLLFDAWSYPSRGRPFHRLGIAARAAQIASWEASSLEFRRGLMTFYRSFAIFGLYSELYERNGTVRGHDGGA